MHSDPGNLAQDFMIDLARRKRGQMRRYSFSEGGAALRRYMIESAPKPYTTHAGWKSPHIGIDAQTQRKAPMAKDFWGRAPRIDVQQPDRNEIYVEHGTDVYHQQVFNHHWLDPQHIENGGPEPVTIGTRPTDMRIIESAGPQRTMVAAKKPGFIGGLFSSSSSSSRQQQALPAPQPEYRGEMRSASMPQHTALPAPQRQAAPQPRARALPAPQGRPAPPQPPLQIEHQPQGLLQAIIFGPNKQKVR
jgi:hypothetical protein